MSIMKEGWESFEQTALRDSISEKQCENYRHIFYSGAFYLFSEALKRIWSPDVSPISKIELVLELGKEFNEWREKIMAGQLKQTDKVNCTEAAQQSEPEGSSHD